MRLNSCKADSNWRTLIALILPIRIGYNQLVDEKARDDLKPYDLQWIRFLLSVWLVLISTLLMLILLVPRIIRAEVGDDLLVYSLSGFNRETALMLYDPSTRMSAPILTNLGFAFRAYRFSVDGRLAYFSSHDGELYVLDVLSADSIPINISQNPATYDVPLAWSPDGRYLAFTSYVEEDDKQIYVWDGETSVNITPDRVDSIEGFQTAWSYDGRLAFTVWYWSSSRDRYAPSEIYLWDGHATTNLSQNPAAVDYTPIWNVDGHLVFLSSLDSDYDIFIWDGVSVENGSPDVDTFTRTSIQISPVMLSPIGWFIWTHDGRLAFGAQSPQDTHVQIYLWDGQTVTNISQNPTLHNGTPTWNANGQWAFVTFFSSQQLLYVRDADNHTLLTVEGQYAPAWSSRGSLAFCSYTSPGWVLSMWNGQWISSIAQGWEISAQWQNGEGVHCSNG